MILSLSYPISEDSPMYGGGRGFEREVLRSLSCGDATNSFRFSMPNHFGTHVDVPLHFIEGGKSLEEYPPDHWIFNDVEVVECPKKPGDMIEAADVVLIRNTNATLVLFKTGFGRQRAHEDYISRNPGISKDAAIRLRARPKLKAVGIDSISVTAYERRELGREVHRILLGNVGDSEPLCLIEDMNLEMVNSGAIRKVMVAPLMIRGGDGSPCTVWAE